LCVLLQQVENVLLEEDKKIAPQRVVLWIVFHFVEKSSKEVIKEKVFGVFSHSPFPLLHRRSEGNHDPIPPLSIKEREVALGPTAGNFVEGLHDKLHHANQNKKRANGQNTPQQSQKRLLTTRC
jgi:hypothetical protein